LTLTYSADIAIFRRTVCGKYYAYLYVDIHPANFFVPISRQFSTSVLCIRLQKYLCLGEAMLHTPLPLISWIRLITIHITRCTAHNRTVHIVLDLHLSTLNKGYHSCSLAIISTR
jgi:hypothetical protein